MLRMLILDGHCGVHSHTRLVESRSQVSPPHQRNSLTVGKEKRAACFLVSKSYFTFDPIFVQNTLRLDA
jgi:hypothetical protein